MKPNATNVKQRLKKASRTAAQSDIPTWMEYIVKESVARTEAQRSRLVAELESELADADQGETDLIRQTLTALRGFKAPFAASLPAAAVGAKTVMMETQIKCYVAHLERHAAGGNSRCLELLAETAARMVDRLNELVQTPNLAAKLRPFAEKHDTWPVLKSPHPGYSQNERVLIELLNVGKAANYVLDKYAKWKPRGEASKLALEFVNEATNIRENAALIQVFRPLSDLENAVTEVEPLQKNPVAWFDLAKRYFEKQPEKLAPLNRKVCAYKGKARRLGISSHVWTELKRAFESMAGKTAEKALEKREKEQSKKRPSRCSN